MQQRSTPSGADNRMSDKKRPHITADQQLLHDLELFSVTDDPTRVVELVMECRRRQANEERGG